MKKSLHSLLEGIVDYAGLFPPAQLTMPQAVANYARYRLDESAWMLGRIILPLARLDEFAMSRDEVAPVTGNAAPWRLSVLGSGDVQRDLERISRFNSGEDATNKAQQCVIDALEFKPSSVADVRRLSELKHQFQIVAREPDGGIAKDGGQSIVEIFCEIPVGENADVMLDAIAEAGVCVKVRTGGTSADMFPTAHDLANFIHGCARRGIAFKPPPGFTILCARATR
jgi:hypothetical protein